MVAKAGLVAQVVKNLPTMQKTCVQSLHQEDTLEKGMATHSSILAWRISCLGAEIAFVSEHHAVMIFPLHILEIMEVVAKALQLVSKSHCVRFTEMSL